MKKILGVTASLLILLFVTSSAFSLTGNKPKTSLGNPAGITYLVEVNMMNVGSLCHTYQVVLADENGIPISSPITYQAGITNYVFHESNSVNGTRIAHFEKVSSSNPIACGQSIFSSPEVITNFFREGSTYHFQLNPTIVPGND